MEKNRVCGSFVCGNTNVENRMLWTDEVISEAEKEYATEGVLLDAREVLFSLRRKHFDTWVLGMYC